MVQALAEENLETGKPEWNYKMLFVQTIAIVAMVLGHAGFNLPILANAIFPYYSWHMPLFVFVSGYFISAKGGYFAFVGRKCKRLLLPALLVRLALALLAAVACYSGLLQGMVVFSPYTILVDPFIECAAFPFSNGMWFIFQLFLLEMIMGALIRIPWKRISFIIVLVSLLMSVAALYIVDTCFSEYPKGLSLVVTRSAFLLFFMAAGHWYRQWEGKVRIKPWLLLSIIVLAQSAFLVFTGSNIEFSAHTMELRAVPFFFSPIITTLTATAALLCVAKMLLPVLKGNRLVLAIGSHTKDILYYHQICLLLINCVYMVLYHRTGSTLFKGFYFDMIRAAWYAFPLGGASLGQLPYILVSLSLPVLIPSWIKKVPKTWQKIALTTALWLLLAAYLIVMGKYAVEAVGLPR